MMQHCFCDELAYAVLSTTDTVQNIACCCLHTNELGINCVEAYHNICVCNGAVIVAPSH